MSETTDVAVREASDGFALAPAEFSKHLDAEKQKRALLLGYVRDQLKAGADYGLVHRKLNRTDYCPHRSETAMWNEPGELITCPACGAKYSLWKSGAEGITGLLQVRGEFAVDKETMDALGLNGKGVAFVCHLVSLNSGAVLAEGRGAGELGANRDNINRTIKMAKKSALIDAAILLGGMSALFTQDVEDMPIGERARYEEQAAPRRDASPPPTREPAPPAGDAPICRTCGGPMWDNRDRRKQAKADRTRGKKAPPAWKCKDKDCGGVIWPSDPNEEDGGLL